MSVTARDVRDTERPRGRMRQSSRNESVSCRAQRLRRSPLSQYCVRRAAEDCRETAAAETVECGPGLLVVGGGLPFGETIDDGDELRTCGCHTPRALRH